jgi:hypothetical protein
LLLRLVEHFAIRGVKIREKLLKHILYPIIINQSSWVGSKHVIHELPKSGVLVLWHRVHLLVARKPG